MINFEIVPVKEGREPENREPEYSQHKCSKIDAKKNYPPLARGRACSFDRGVEFHVFTAGGYSVVVYWLATVDTHCMKIVLCFMIPPYGMKVSHYSAKHFHYTDSSRISIATR